MIGIDASSFPQRRKKGGGRETKDREEHYRRVKISDLFNIIHCAMVNNAMMVNSVVNHMVSCISL